MRTTALAALAAAVLALAACSADPQPKFEPTPSSTTTTTSSSSSPTQQPQSAEDFIREWFDLSRTMQNTGSTEDFLALSPRCSTCRKFADRVETIYSHGGFVKVGGLAVTSIRSISDGTYVVTIDAGKTIYKSSARGHERHLDGGINRFRMELRDTTQGWRMHDYQDMT